MSEPFEYYKQLPFKINQMVAEHVAGWKREGGVWINPDSPKRDKFATVTPDYCSNANLVIELFKNFWRVQITQNDDNAWEVSLWANHGPFYHTVTSKSFIDASLIAMLRAKDIIVVI